MFLPFVIFLLQLHLPRQRLFIALCLCLQEEAAASNWQVSVLVSPAKWLALLLYSFLLSM